MKKGLKNLLALGLIAFLVFLFWDEINRGFREAKDQLFPCKEPIEYSIGVFDKRFGVAEAEFLRAIQEAERIWEEPSGLDLFQYKAEGELKINLAYDSRQEATQKLAEIDEGIGSDKEKHASLRADYESLRAEYLAEKEAFETRVVAFEKQRTTYENQAEFWNEKGGAPKAEYEKLESDRRALNTESQALAEIQKDLNTKIDEINALATALNQLAQRMNQGVVRFNDIVDNHGEEFEEGNYEKDALGERINIYQFEDETKLLRVLAHEFGHALDIGHVADPDAIMYRLNDSSNTRLTQDDLEALQEKCKI